MRAVTAGKPLGLAYGPVAARGRPQGLAGDDSLDRSAATRSIGAMRRAALVDARRKLARAPTRCGKTRQAKTHENERARFGNGTRIDAEGCQEIGRDDTIHPS